MTTRKIEPIKTIKSPCNNKKSLYGQNLKPQSKFDYVFKKELRRLKDEQINNLK